MTNPYHTHRLDERKAQMASSRDFDEAEVSPWVIEFRVVGTPDTIQAQVHETMLIGRVEVALAFLNRLFDIERADDAILRRA
ncbi:MAG: hypothetical protein SNJ83_05380, partial [Aggregatilineales bacterium]